MQWPKDILDAFDRALKVEPVEGVDALTVLRTMLDETARRAVWRAGGNPALASAALRTPMTPLGSVTNERINGLAQSYTLHGAHWGVAVDSFHGYIEENAAAVFAAFAEQERPYRDFGFGPIAPPPREEATGD